MKLTTKTMVTVGMFAAILSVLSILAIPTPNGVPFTLQTFAVALCGYVLGAKYGVTTVLIYILIGAIGIPVYSGMRGGISWLFSYTGGFLWGFLFLAALCGRAMTKKNLVYRMGLSVAGLFLCHVLGVLQFSIVAETSFVASFLTASVPYLLKDIISIMGAYAVALPIKRGLI